jgi:hypothetical protein
MTVLPTELTISIDAGPGADEQELAELTQHLRDDLLETGVEPVEQVRRAEAPAGSKGDAVTLATLAVTLAPIALREFMKALQTWLSRHERASVTVVESGGEKIVVTGSPSKEQQQVIDALVRRRKT